MREGAWEGGHGRGDMRIRGVDERRVERRKKKKQERTIKQQKS